MAIDEKRLAHDMAKLHETREAILAMWEADKEIEQGKPQAFDLSPEQEKAAKKMAKGKKAPCYSLDKAKPRERKPNEEKREIIKKLGYNLGEWDMFGEEFAQTVQTPNAEREITFTIGENDYSLVLTCHRKPKKWPESAGNRTFFLEKSKKHLIFIKISVIMYM